MHVAVKIAQPDDVEAERLHGGQIRERRVERPGCPHAFGEPKMPVVA